jgi:hypothetical protein
MPSTTPARRRARQGIDHNGQADLDCERWFYTDAGLLKLLSRGILLAYPTKPLKSSRSPSQADCIMLLQQHSSSPFKTDEAQRRGRARPEQRPRFQRRMYRRGHGLCYCPHTSPPPSCMQDVKRRRQRRPHGLIGGVLRRNQRE